MNPTPRMKNSTLLISIDLGADVDVGLADGLRHLRQRDAVGAHLDRVDVDLVLLDVAADRGDLGNALDGVELVADVPVLDRAQFGQVEAFALDRVPVDLAERRWRRARARARRPRAASTRATFIRSSTRLRAQ